MYAPPTKENLPAGQCHVTMGQNVVFTNFVRTVLEFVIIFGSLKQEIFNPLQDQTLMTEECSIGTWYNEAVG